MDEGAIMSGFGAIIASDWAIMSSFGAIPPNMWANIKIDKELNKFL
jgi:hypothetical protein